MHYSKRNMLTRVVESNIDDQMFDLLNEINSVDWIIHFLPTIGQLCQQRETHK